MDVKRIQADVRVRDPAYRDQDQYFWRQGRFAERVRREWNPVRTAAIDGADSLDELAKSIHAIVGGEIEHILERLRLFQAMEQYGPDGARDSLIPGHSH